MGHRSGTETQLISLFNDHRDDSDAASLLVSLVVVVVGFFIGVVFVTGSFSSVSVVIAVVVAILILLLVGVSMVVGAVRAVYIAIVHHSHELNVALQIHTLAFRPASGVLLVDDLLEANVVLGSAVVLVVELAVVSVVGVQGVGSDEVLGISDDAVSGGHEVGGLLAVESSAQTTDAISEAVVGFNLDAASVVDEGKSSAGDVDDHFVVGLSVDLSDSLVLVVGDFGDCVLGNSLFFLVDLDLSVGVIAGGGRGLHVNDVFAVVQNNLDVLLVLSRLFHQDGDVVLSLGLVIDLVVFSLFGSGGHQNVPGVLKIQRVGFVVVGLSGGTVSNTHG